MFSITLSCNNSSNQKNIDTQKAIGSVNYGGVFHINEIDNFRSLVPHKITDMTSRNIAGQMYEGLVSIDSETMKVVPSLAESWEISDDGLTYTFHLTSNVYFHDDPCFNNGKGRLLNADDIIFSFKELFTKSDQNDLSSPMADIVLGAKFYYVTNKENEEEQNNVIGLKWIDNSTISISLIEPYSGFLNLLATPAGWIYPYEAVNTYGAELRLHCVGTGPFVTKKVIDDEIIILARNKNYWKKDSLGNQLPYLDAIKINFLHDKEVEVSEFVAGNLDMVYNLTREDVNTYNINTDIIEGEYSTGDFIVQICPSMSIQYYGFQQMSDVFRDVNVRKAFNYAIDRKSIVKNTLNGIGLAANNGIVPPSIDGYPFSEVKGYKFSKTKAQNYLSKAGYPGGKGFPRFTLSLNSGGGPTNLMIAEEIQKMLYENLGIYIDLSMTSFSKHYERVEHGEIDFWRDSWMADYNDPENFLYLFYGSLVPEDKTDPSIINSTRYNNSDFNKLYESALYEEDPNIQMELYRQADQKIIDDAVVIPLYYEKTIRFVQPYVKNFMANPMELRDFGHVYFDYSNTK